MNLQIELIITFTCIFVGVQTQQDPMPLNMSYSWRFVEYDFDTLHQKNEAIASGRYNYTSNFLTDLERVYDGRTFVTILRDIGAPASLATISGPSQSGGGPVLRPYPDWSWTDTNDCNNIIAVYRTTQDSCGRLWVLDTGKVGDKMACPPKLLAFDLLSNELDQRIDIPSELATNANGTGLLVTVVVDIIGNDCANPTIYMADMYGSGLVIWTKESSWRMESPYFKPESDALEFSVAGTRFEFVRGLFALAITPDVQNPLNRRLYFRPLSSDHMYYTNVTDLLLEKGNQSSIKYFTEPTKLTSQSTVHAFSSKGILFFSGTTEMSILCWNRHKPFTPENIVTVAQDNETLQWASGIKIYQDGLSETLWVLTDRWQDYYENKMNFNDTNFRIFTGCVDDLVRGTNCE